MRLSLALPLAAAVALGFAAASSHAEPNAQVAAKARPAPAPSARTIVFSGRTWTVKGHSERLGPGPNYFSNGPQNVWVDAQGRLHLKITKVKGRWYCAEIVLNESLGHGTYRFYLDSPVDNLDPNVVLGLFTWNDDPAYNHREIDIEFARWGVAGDRNAQYVVQPYTEASNIHVFDWPAGVAASTHSFRWLTGSVAFESVAGSYLPPPATNTVIHNWTFNGASTPIPGGENARLNLWLFQGRAPVNGREVEVIVRRFEFVPG